MEIADATSVLKPSAELEGAGEFSSLKPPLHPSILKVLRDDLHFQAMSPVQASTIPLFMSNKDVAVEAPTGSGKTLSFVIPVLQILLKAHEKEHQLRSNEMGGLIISPTRELALQTNEAFRVFLKEEPFRSIFGPAPLCLIGAHQKIEQDLENYRLNSAKIVVATPGRFEEFLSCAPLLSFKYFEVLVLDEADRLLDLGFEATLNRILEKLPRQRRTGLFSATQTQAVRALARAGMRNPVRVALAIEYRTTVKGSEATSIQHTPASLTNSYCILEPREKLVQLAALLVHHPERKYIIYFMTCACVDFFYHLLAKTELLLSAEFRRRFPVLSAHGQTLQANRQRTYKRFLAMQCGALLTTDMASRGLDIPKVDVVVQFDPPQNPDAFVHRIGRTARMGNEGQALAFLMRVEDIYVPFLREKGVPISEVPKIEGPDVKNSSEVLAQLRELASRDRDVMVAGQIAFLSYIRAYKNHHCSFIFRVKALDFGALASSFGLLKMPLMPELRGQTVTDFQPTDIDTDTIPFTNPSKERKRLAGLSEELRKRAERKSRWEARHERKAKFMRGRGKKKDADAKKKNKPHEFDDDDIAEINREAKLMKKLKSGKISLSEFDQQIGDDIEEPAKQSSTGQSSSSSSSSTTSSSSPPTTIQSSSGSSNQPPSSQSSTSTPSSSDLSESRESSRPAKRSQPESDDLEQKKKKKKKRRTKGKFNRSVTR